MGDFGKILEEWQSLTQKQGRSGKKPSKGPAVHSMERWLNHHGVEDKDFSREDEMPPRPTRRELLAMPPQDRLNIHGYSLKEALAAADRFIAEAFHAGFRKILIIHGKGYHSPGKDSILRKEVRLFLEQNPKVGEFGFADRTSGGKGATWLILKDGG